MAALGLAHGPPGPRAVHLAVDMQRLFAPDGPWPTPWMERVLPRVAVLAAHRPAATIFTRFVPPADPESVPGTWRRLYARWPEVARAARDPALLALADPLGEFVPPAEMVDKPTYSAFATGALPARLAERGADTLIVSGAETDVCVVATVFGAVDRGYRVILAADALCSSSDMGHDALMAFYRRRLGQQIEVATTEEVMAAWT